MFKILLSASKQSPCDSPHISTTLTPLDSDSAFFYGMKILVDVAALIDFKFSPYLPITRPTYLSGTSTVRSGGPKGDFSPI
jgi:hypothetical protein